MHLQELDLQHQDAFLTMAADYLAKDPEAQDLPQTPAAFKLFVKKCQQEKMDWRPKAGKISRTRYVLVNGTGEICGNGVLRFPLDEKIERDGGNLIFDVPPSQRGHDYGALTLNRMLFEAVRAGMARVFVCCTSDNVPARKAIEKNRGEEAGQKDGRVSYWIHFR